MTDTQANLNANTWDYQRSVDSVRIIYKSCGIDNVCPVEPGETIVQDCPCQNEFAYAVSHLQVLDEASKDMICAPKMSIVFGKKFYCMFEKISVL